MHISWMWQTKVIIMFVVLGEIEDWNDMYQA